MLSDLIAAARAAMREFRRRRWLRSFRINNPSEF